MKFAGYNCLNCGVSVKKGASGGAYSGRVPAPNPNNPDEQGFVCYSCLIRACVRCSDISVTATNYDYGNNILQRASLNPRFLDTERVFARLVWVDDEEGESYQVCEGCVLPEDVVYDEEEGDD